MVTTPRKPGSTQSGESSTAAHTDRPAGAPKRSRGQRIVLSDLAMHIDHDGTWFYHGSPIRRKELVCLFASALTRDAAGDYWLVTPTEMGRVEVADVPFIGVELYVAGRGRDQIVSIRTNVDEIITVDGEHPLRGVAVAGTAETIPYLQVRDGIEARIIRAVYYEMVSLGTEADVAGEKWLGLWSSSQFFPLGKLDESL